VFNKSNTMNLVVLPHPEVKESGKMIVELEALGCEPFLVMLLESHSHRCEHMNIWGQILRWCKLFQGKWGVL